MFYAKTNVNVAFNLITLTDKLGSSPNLGLLILFVKFTRTLVLSCLHIRIRGDVVFCTILANVALLSTVHLNKGG